VCGWSYWFARSVGFAVQLVAIQNVISFWDLDSNLRAVWITIFFVAIVLFNLLNVRNLGEIEFWLALTKIEGIVVLIILGLVLSMGASVGTRQLGTSPDNTTAIPCTANVTQPCVEALGFDCMIPPQLRLNRRLDGGSFPCLLLRRSFRATRRILARLLPGYLRLPRSRHSRTSRRGNRETTRNTAPRRSSCCISYRVLLRWSCFRSRFERLDE